MKNTLRAWQKTAISSALDHFKKGNDLFLIEAVTGGGKTTAASEIALTLLKDGNIKKIIIICPSIEIKNGWNTTMTKLGMTVTSEISNSAAPDIDAYISTYQGGENVTTSGKTLLIVDEVHHAERTASWGALVSDIDKLSVYTIALTGTPWMTNGKIALLKDYYSMDGMIKPSPPSGISYKYREDLVSIGDDRGTVPVKFRFFESKSIKMDGKKQVKEDGKPVIDVVFDPVTKENIEKIADKYDVRPLTPHVHITSNRLSNNSMARSMLSAGVHELDSKQSSMKNRGKGLVVCKSIDEAKMVGEYMNAALGVRSEVIVSDDQGSSDRLKEIADGSAHNPPEWIISVGMVAEGVDIPEIKVVVYLSAIMTMLFLIQLIGRALRRIPKAIDKKKPFDGYLDGGLYDTQATVIMPAHPFLVYMAHELEKDVEYAAKKKKKNNDDNGGGGEDVPDYGNIGKEQGEDIARGHVISHDINRLLDAVFNDADAIEVIDGDFKSWIFNLCNKGMEEKARKILTDIINENDIYWEDTESLEEELSYDAKVSLAKKEARRLVVKIRFSNSWASVSEKEAYGEIRKMITKRCFGKWISFAKMSLDQKEAWVDCAREYYERGTS